MLVLSMAGLIDLECIRYGGVAVQNQQLLRRNTKNGNSVRLRSKGRYWCDMFL